MFIIIILEALFLFILSGVCIIIAGFVFAWTFHFAIANRETKQFMIDDIASKLSFLTGGGKL